MGRVYTNALCVAGYTPDGVSVNNTESWNGSSWTEVNNLNVARRGGGSQTGTNTSALFLGGLTNPPPVYTKTVEEWDGVSWVEVADMSASGGFGVAGVAADSTSALAFGGAPPVSVATEEWSSTSNTTKTIDQD